MRFPNVINSVKTIISKNYCTCNELYATQIRNATVVCTDHLTPEIKLHLITKKCQLWHSPADQCQFEDPFWAFYWPGGQAISR